MKKEWVNPKMNLLAVNSTNEELDCESAEYNEVTKCFWPHKHICRKCGKDFGHRLGSHLAWQMHENCCKGNGDEEEDIVIPPVS